MHWTHTLSWNNKWEKKNDNHWSNHSIPFDSNAYFMILCFSFSVFFTIPSPSVHQLNRQSKDEEKKKLQNKNEASMLSTTLLESLDWIIGREFSIVVVLFMFHENKKLNIKQKSQQYTIEIHEFEWNQHHDFKIYDLWLLCLVFWSMFRLFSFSLNASTHFVECFSKQF